jgi:hypothetical protein
MDDILSVLSSIFEFYKQQFLIKLETV